MRLKLNPRWTEKLRVVPESGMGYQRVDVRFADGRVLNGALVFNAEELEAPKEFSDAEIVDVRLSGGPPR